MPIHSPGPVPKEALAFFRAKSFKPGFDHRDVWRQEHATAFNVAKAMDMDILTAIRGSVDNALEMGLTYREYSQQLTPLLQKLGWWGKQDVVDPKTGETVTAQLGSPRRLKTIYDANLRTARSAGQWDRAQRTKKTHPYLVYELGPSENHRPEHVSWAGIMLAVDHPWWNSHFPTNGYGCKCRVRQVSKREYARLNATGRYLTDPPEDKTIPWLNKRTGEVEQVPVGIDPGWDTNPGKVGREATAKKQLNEKAAVFKQAVKQPLPAPPSLWPADSNPVFSTVKGVDRAGIESVISKVPNAQTQLEKLGRYMAAHPCKVICVKSAEMGRGKQAHALADEVKKFLGITFKYHPMNAYTMKSGSQRTGGFTHTAFEHITVKVGAKDRLAAVDVTQLPKMVEAAIAAHNGQQPGLWAIPYAIKGLPTVDELIPTLAHELGHQVHYWAGSPIKPLGAHALTQYAKTDSMEWHAEHFTAWLLNRKALAKWDSSIAKYFDDLIEAAIISDKKG